jgi:hypothetical protein
MPTFQTRDPSIPEFWTERFEQNIMPWDRAGVPAELQRFVTTIAGPKTALIPGCGMAYEVRYLSEAGWDVTAIDFSAAAVTAAKAQLGEWAGRVMEADFFTFTPSKSLDLIYERAFLCALPRPMWPDIVARWADLLPAGALLVGYFYFDEAVQGPPFGAERRQLEQLLKPHFKQVDDQAVTDSVAVFAGKERWQVWRRLV